MKREDPQNRRVVCIHSLKDYAGQEHFSGILDYCRGHTTWSITLVDPEDLGEQNMQRICQRKPHGIIVTKPGLPKYMKALVDSSVPIVFANVGGFHLPPKRRRISFVWTDNADIGEKGARFLLSLADFKSFAFVNDREESFWATERNRAFRECLSKAGKTCMTISPSEPLTDRLAELPKPAALMASHDLRAAEVIAACGRLGLSVPGQVAVLGADDDPALRKRIHPTISSVHIDFHRMGCCDAEELDRLMSNPNCKGRPEILIPAGEVIPRQSTRQSAAREDLVSKINAYIDAHALTNVNIADLIKAIGCSRRLTELRFRQATGTSLRKALESVRIGKAIELISSTNDTAKDIARRCGFPSRDALSRALSANRNLTFKRLRARARSDDSPSGRRRQ